MGTTTLPRLQDQNLDVILITSSQRRVIPQSHSEQSILPKVTTRHTVDSNPTLFSGERGLGTSLAHLALACSRFVVFLQGKGDIRRLSANMETCMFADMLCICLCLSTVCMGMYKSLCMGMCAYNVCFLPCVCVLYLICLRSMG